ncbi:MAG: MBL fold metallo-hydrolase, partial [Thermoplasmata archaeon]
MAEIRFLGTGGGRFATILQARATGGIYIEDGRTKLHIDPGPGALVQMKKYGINPMKIDALLISHCHPDHYVDAPVIIEAMSKGGKKKRGALLGSKSI